MQAWNQAVSEPWIRLTLGPLPPDFSALLRDAQRHCYPLRQVRVLSVERRALDERSDAEFVTLLAPPQLVALLETPAPGEWTREFSVATYVYSLSIEVLEGAGELIPF